MPPTLARLTSADPNLLRHQGQYAAGRKPVRHHLRPHLLPDGGRRTDHASAEKIAYALEEALLLWVEDQLSLLVERNPGLSLRHLDGCEEASQPVDEAVLEGLRARASEPDAGES